MANFKSGLFFVFAFIFIGHIVTAEFDVNGCYCPGQQISIQCTTTGAGSTRYNVTGCNIEDLNLLHSRFTNQGARGECDTASGLEIVAENKSTDGDSFTSILNITVPLHSLRVDGVFVGCYHDSGLPVPWTPIGNTTLVSDPAPPDNISIKIVSENSLLISWHRPDISDNCHLQYTLNASNCGHCQDSVSTANMSCIDVPFIEKCTATVSTVICENITGPPSPPATVQGLALPSTSVATPITTSRSDSGKIIGSALGTLLSIVIIIALTIIIILIIYICLKSKRKRIHGLESSRVQFDVSNIDSVHLSNQQPDGTEGNGTSTQSGSTSATNQDSNTDGDDIHKKLHEMEERYDQLEIKMESINKELTDTKTGHEEWYSRMSNQMKELKESVDSKTKALSQKTLLLAEKETAIKELQAKLEQSDKEIDIKNKELSQSSKALELKEKELAQKDKELKHKQTESDLKDTVIDMQMKLIQELREDKEKLKKDVSYLRDEVQALKSKVDIMQNNWDSSNVESPPNKEGTKKDQSDLKVVLTEMHAMITSALGDNHYEKHTEKPAPFKLTENENSNHDQEEAQQAK